MTISLNYADHRLDVQHTVQLTNTSAELWEQVIFAVPQAHYPGVFLLQRVELEMPQSLSVPRLTQDGTMLSVLLPTPLLPGEPVRISLSYSLVAPQIDWEVWLPVGNFGAGAQLLQAGDWHPTLVPYVEGLGWQQWSYYPVGDPHIYPIADYAVEILAPSAVTVAAPGLRTVQGRSRIYCIERARSFALLASPEYRRMEGISVGIPINVYYLPGHAAEAQAVMDAAVGSLMAFTDLYGPYPYSDLTIAENAYRGTMEYSGLISMSGVAYATYEEHPLSSLVTLVAHETAHQWWYGAVGNDQVHEPWLDESLAKYSELLFYERFYPDEAESWWRLHMAGVPVAGTLNRSIYAFEDTPSYINDIYGLGARFIADVRQLLGDAAFFEFLKAYHQAGDGRLVTQADFLRVLQQFTDANLDPLLATYFDEDEPDLEQNAAPVRP